MDQTAPPIQQSARDALIPNLSAGVVIGFSEFIYAISLASLIFSGPLVSDIGRGAAIGLVAAGMNICVVALLSKRTEIIAGVQENSAILLAVAAAAIVASMTPADDPLPTVIALLFASTMLTGAAFYILGRFRLGGLARYVPYPVIGGFLAGTGYLLVQGSIGAMADFALTLDNIPDLMTGDQLILWGPGVAFGFAIFVGMQFSKHYLTMPALIIGGIVIFYLTLLLAGETIDSATDRGLLFGKLGDAASWRPLPVDDLQNADWDAVFSQIGNIGAIIAVSIIHLLLNISSLELVFEEDIELDHELRVMGASNVLSGLFGGIIGFHSLSVSSLNYRMGGRTRLSGLIAGAICFSGLALGSTILTYVPKPLLGGLLLYLGLGFLQEWIIEGVRKFEPVDYGVVILIVVIIATSGFLVGVSVGLMLMIVLFIVNYSRLNLFYRAASGEALASAVIRNTHHQRSLTRLGRHVFALELQGFIFFGAAHGIIERIHERINDVEQKKLMYLILDFRRVTGLDSSAIFSFVKIKHMIDANDLTLVLTNVPDDVVREFHHNGLYTDDHFLLFPDLDHGIEYCEDALLRDFQVTQKRISATLNMQLVDNGFKRADALRLMAYLERIELSPGDILMQQGDPADDLVFIELGQVSVYLELESGSRVRLQKHIMGAILGEVGFYLNTPRSATVIADYETKAYRLTREALQKMKEEAPDLASDFNEMIVRLVGQRLITTNRVLAAFNR